MRCGSIFVSNPYAPDICLFLPPGSGQLDRTALHRVSMIDRRDIAFRCRKARQLGYPPFFIPAHSLPTDATPPLFSPDMILLRLICSFRQSFFQITKSRTHYVQ